MRSSSISAIPNAIRSLIERATRRAGAFCILAYPRTGSTLLVELLGSHPEITCHNELFHPNQVGAWLSADDPLMSVAARDRNPQAFLDNILGLRRGRIDARALGFKLLMNRSQIRLGLPAVARNRRFRKIVLTRKNHLASYSSLRIALETGSWFAWKPEDLRDQRVTFRPREFLAHVRARERSIARLIRCLQTNRQKHLVLDYTDIGTASTFRTLEKFLGVTRFDGWHAAILKQNTQAPIERFENPDCVRECMLQLGKETWLTDP